LWATDSEAATTQVVQSAALDRVGIADAEDAKLDVEQLLEQSSAADAATAFRQAYVANSEIMQQEPEQDVEQVVGHVEVRSPVAEEATATADAEVLPSLFEKEALLAQEAPVASQVGAAEAKDLQVAGEETVVALGASPSHDAAKKFEDAAALVEGVDSEALSSPPAKRTRLSSGSSASQGSAFAEAHEEKAPKAVDVAEEQDGESATLQIWSPAQQRTMHSTFSLVSGAASDEEEAVMTSQASAFEIPPPWVKEQDGALLPAAAQEAEEGEGHTDVPIHGEEGPCGAFAESAKEAFLDQTSAGTSEASPIACPGEVGALLVSDECTPISSPSGVQKRRLQEDGGIVESPASLKRMRVKTDHADADGVEERMQPASLGA